MNNHNSERLLEIIERAEVENMRVHSQALAINAGNDEVLKHQLGVMLYHLQEQESYLAMAKSAARKALGGRSNESH